MIHLIRILFSLSAINAYGAELQLNFESATSIESSSLVVNTQQGRLHPTLRVLNYNGPNTFDFSVGDGRHGPFNPSTYQNFSVDGDLTGQRILIDVNEYPTLQVTEFNLESGWRIEVTGGGPLVIYSLSDVTIAGEIWCHGEDGGSATNATPGTGGSGRCGGGAGGDGGLPGQDGSPGEDVDALVTGGGGGNYIGVGAVSGGGGGSWNTSSVAGSGVGGGRAGAMQSDPEFNTLAGGAGGGGGSGSDTEAGAGGGGGGGTVIIHAVGNFNLGQLLSSNFGRILASGGRGGNSNVAGGAGGGGGGGSVRIFVGGNIEMLNTDGTGAGVATIGLGGSNFPGDSGGNGGQGRNWYSSINGGYNTILGGGGGYYTPPEQGIAPGDVQFTTVAQSAETVSIDTGNTRPRLNSLSTTPVSSDFVVEVKGSDDDFQSDDADWSSDLSQASGKRYLKFRITITTADPTNPSLLSQVLLDYTPTTEGEFDFVAASCGRVQGPTQPGVPLLLFLLPFLLLIRLSRFSA